MGTYGYDADFLKAHAIEFLELYSPDGQSKVLIAPGYQGRVMTTTAAGDAGDSYGWLNYKLIGSGEVSPQFNPVGGEERFWLGPEGRPLFSLLQTGSGTGICQLDRAPANRHRTL